MQILVRIMRYSKRALCAGDSRDNKGVIYKGLVTQFVAKTTKTQSAVRRVGDNGFMRTQSGGRGGRAAREELCLRFKIGRKQLIEIVLHVPSSAREYKGSALEAFFFFFFFGLAFPEACPPLLEQFVRRRHVS